MAAEQTLRHQVLRDDHLAQLQRTCVPGRALHTLKDKPYPQLNMQQIQTHRHL